MKPLGGLLSENQRFSLAGLGLCNYDFSYLMFRSPWAQGLSQSGVEGSSQHRYVVVVICRYPLIVGIGLCKLRIPKNLHLKFPGGVVGLGKGIVMLVNAFITIKSRS